MEHRVGDGCRWPFSIQHVQAVLDQPPARLVLSDEEKASDTVLLHSELFGQQDGSWRWTADHPSGWVSAGEGPNPPACQDEIDRRVAKLLGLKVDESVRINRLHHD